MFRSIIEEHYMDTKDSAKFFFCFILINRVVSDEHVDCRLQIIPNNNP